MLGAAGLTRPQRQVERGSARCRSPGQARCLLHFAGPVDELALFRSLSKADFLISWSLFVFFFYISELEFFV